MRDIPMQLKILEIVKEYESKEEQDKIITQPRNILTVDSFGKHDVVKIGTNNIRKYIDVKFLNDNYFMDSKISYIRENVRLMEENGFITTRKSRSIKLEPNLEIINITNLGYDFIDDEGEKRIPEVKVQSFEDIPEQLKIMNKYFEESNFLKADEITLMKTKLEELRRNDTSLPWDTLINGLNLLITFSSLIKK